MFRTKQLFGIALIFISTSGSLITSKQTTKCCEEYCYEDDTSRLQYKKLGVYTPYAFAKGNDTQIYNIPGCSAEKIWMLVRHGTRLLEPGDDVPVINLERLRDEIVLLYGNNLTLPEKGGLCEADFNLIKNWKWDANLTAQYDGTLTVSGWNELKDLGKDYRNTFPDLFGNTYSSERLRFEHTDHRTNRTEATYKAFVEGLFGDGSYNDIILDRAPQPSRIQRPMAFCPAYNENVDVQSDPNSETSKFRNSEIFLKLRNDVSVKLGFSEPLSDLIIVNIYDMCRFEKAWNIEKSSPWCSVLTPTQFDIIEYLDDLTYYMERSYGSPINSKLYCFGMDEMLSYIATDALPKVVAYFGHTFEYYLYLTALGAFHDTTPLRNDNFDAMANRKWKNSEINPAASNIATVRYNCPNDVEEKVKLKFFVNQKTLNFDWCDSSGLCNLSDVLEQYSVFINGDCEDIFCSTGDSSGSKLSSKLMLILFFSLFSLTLVSFRVNRIV